MIRVVCLAIGYLFGLFQTSYIIGKMHGIDIRDYGSGNAGSTNISRTLGSKYGLITFIGDFAKCALAITLVRVLFRDRYPDILRLLMFYAGVGAVLGHNYPFYLGFRGGKGVAATAGMMVAVPPIMGILGVITFAVTFLVTHYVSVGSLSVYVGIFIELPILGQNGYLGMSQAHLNELYLLGLFLVVQAFWKHRENIKRLIAGTEPKSYVGKKHQGEGKK